jgi:hypothetical protein
MIYLQFPCVCDQGEQTSVRNATTGGEIQVRQLSVAFEPLRWWWSVGEQEKQRSKQQKRVSIRMDLDQ